jgi:hypothetical protein
MVIFIMLSVVVWLAIPPMLSVASVMARGRRPLVSGLQLRLDDVGDGWRALLLGAPPALL